MAAGNNGENAFSKTVTSPSTCKNCLAVGATQLSDSLFRGAKPYVDQGWFCKYSSSVHACCNSALGTPSGISCVQTSETVSPCCSLSLAFKMSLPCCPTQYTCSPNPSVCNVTSGNIRSPYNVASFSGRGTSFDDARIKPDLVVPGEDTLSANGPGSSGSGASAGSGGRIRHQLRA